MSELKIEDFDWSVRCRNALRVIGASTLADLSNVSEAELLRLPNFSRKSLREIKSVLALHGLGLWDSGLEADLQSLVRRHGIEAVTQHLSKLQKNQETR